MEKLLFIVAMFSLGLSIFLFIANVLKQGISEAFKFKAVKEKIPSSLSYVCN